MRNRSRPISIDLRGLVFSAQLIAAVGLLMALAYTTFPLVRYVTGTEDSISIFSRDTVSVQGGLPDEATHADWALADLTSETAHASPPVPAEGKYIAVDVPKMQVVLYESGVSVATFPLLSVPALETMQTLSAGTHVVSERSQEKISTVTLTRFPFYVGVGQHLAFHGAPSAVDGSEVRDAGIIVLSMPDAEQVYTWVDEGTTVGFTGKQVPPAEVRPVAVRSDGSMPATSARAYIVRDLESGHVYLEKNSRTRLPIASITKLVTTLVSTAIIPHTEEVRAPNGEWYKVGDLQYPLLLRSDNEVAHALARHVGTDLFIARMNAHVHTLDMQDTSFADASGLSPRNLSTAHDLSVLGIHLFRHRSFVLAISKEPDMTIIGSTGVRMAVTNQNKLASDPHFLGGKLGFTDEARQTSLATFGMPIEGTVRPVVVVVLGSNDWRQDTRTLLRWLLENTRAIEQR